MINKLEDIAQFISGKAFTSKDFTENPNVEGALPIIRIQNVNSEEAQFKYWNKDYEEKYIVTSGDLLMSLSGDFKLKIWDGPKALLNQRVVKIEINDNVNKFYLFKYLQSKIYILTSMGNSSIINNLSIKTLKNFNIELPNLINQNKIESIIRKLDVQLSKRKKQLKLLDELSESLFIDMFGDILISDNNLVLFNEIIMIDTISTKNFEFYSEYPHIGIENIEKQTGKLKNFKKVKDSNLKSIKYIFNENHIIYSKIRPYLNKVAMPDFSGLCSSDAYPLLVNEDVANKVFIGHLLRQDIFLNYIEKNSTRTNIPKVNKTQLKNFSFNLPPLSLQNDFAQKIEKIEELKKQCQKSLEYYEELYETLLHKAFNGELFNE